MDENEKTPPQKPESDKKLKLDLSEALNQGSDDDDDIIELKDEVTPPSKAKMAGIGRDDQVSEDMQADKPAAAKISGLDVFGEEADVAKNVDHLVDDLIFEEEDEDKEKVDHGADKLPFEEEDEDQTEMLPLVGEEEPLKADADNEVVEITEFDDILSEDSHEMMTLSDVGEELESEEEFLELIDVDEDSLKEEDSVPEMADETAREEIQDDIIQFDGPGTDVEDAELEDFINDSIDEEIRIADNFEDDLTNALEVEDESDINLAATSSGTEEFDFEMDSSEISEKIDALETIFFDESETEAELDEDAEPEAETIGSAVSEAGDDTDEISEKIDGLEDIFFDESEAEAKLDEDAEPEAETIGSAVSEAGDDTDEISEKIDRLETTFFDESEAGMIGSDVSETGDEIDEEEIETTDVEPSGEPPADGSLAALAGASRGQIEKSIERIILNNFSEKIESIVTETIEKAVSKEIDRLKNILLEDGNDDNV
jgi:hypothetical protein